MTRPYRKRSNRMDNATETIYDNKLKSCDKQYATIGWIFGERTPAPVLFTADWNGREEHTKLDNNFPKETKS